MTYKKRVSKRSSFFMSKTIVYFQYKNQKNALQIKFAERF
ncbi:hypothetical protein SAMN05421540_102242 [Psychroflexus halocasei]|uniref:Uncharacterized protein n=1 Tax=Psychroflexus halocasei TaxID=908615 RepID=A0A1H3X478_9FLAO|nr:hypothetical protein SAMN05421540_102242 [Psychroflexus halocasei]